MALWEELFVVLILLKIPVAYVGYVLWWAIKAEPEAGTEGGTEGMTWRPWRRPSPNGPSRPRGGSPGRGAPVRDAPNRDAPNRDAPNRGPRHRTPVRVRHAQARRQGRAGETA